MSYRRKRATSTDFGFTTEEMEEKVLKRKSQEEHNMQAEGTDVHGPDGANPQGGASTSSPPSLASTKVSRIRSSITSRSSSLKSVGCPEKYADRRRMTPLQERINAVTIIPAGLLCLHYMVSGGWLRFDPALVSESGPDVSGCINIIWLPHLPYLPPPSVLAICIGTMMHCPCSFIYHWKAANILDPVKCIKHWSRRLDHSFIHVCSVFWAYALSKGSVAFLILNLVYNADCIRFHWEEEIVPRRNQLRIIGSMLLYTSPLLFMQDDDGSRLQVFHKVWMMFVVALWLFAAYPFAGWSHSAFHIVMLAVPPLLLDMVAGEEADTTWIMNAARCAVMKQ